MQIWVAQLVSDKNWSVVSAAGRALHETDFDKNNAFRLAVEYYEDLSGDTAGANMEERIYREVELQFKNKDVKIPVKPVLSEAKLESYLRSKGE